MEKSPEEFTKQIDELYHFYAIELYNSISGIHGDIFSSWTFEKKKEILDHLITYFKEIGHDDKVKYLEEKMVLGVGFDSGGIGRCVVKLVSVKTVGDVESWGYDSHYLHDIVVDIEENIKDREKYVLEKISNGDFTLGGSKIWCTELEKPLSKDSISKIASKSNSLEEFSNSVMEDMYNSLLDWCRSKWPNAKEREIYSIAKAIEEPMFGGESMDSKSRIDFIYG